MNRRTNILIAGAGIVLAMAAYIHSTATKTMSNDLTAANIEALSANSEIDLKDCDSGCSSVNKSRYCCTLLGFKLYRYP